MYDTAFNKIERELRNEEGVANELDYVEQTSWVLFLKYLHDLEAERRNRAELDGTDYSPILAGPYAWEGAVRRMRTRIGLLAQPEPMRSIVGATQ